MIVDDLLYLFLAAVVVFAMVIDCVMILQYLMQIKEFLSRNSLGLDDDKTTKNKKNLNNHLQ